MKIFKIFAVEPTALDNWNDFKYIMEKFGYSKGLLLSKTPKSWPKILLDNLDVSEIERARFVTRLQKFKNDRMINSGCSYKPEFNWYKNIDQFCKENKIDDIIVSNKTNQEFGGQLETPVSIDEDSFGAYTEVRVKSNALSLCSPALVFIDQSQELVFIDPYFQVYKKQCMNVLLEFIKQAKKIGKCRKFTIYTSSEKSLPKGGQSSITDFCDKYFSSTLRYRYEVTFKYLAELSKNEKFHARYLIAPNKGGLRYDKGFQESIDEHNVDISLLDKKIFEEIEYVYSSNNTELKVENEFNYCSA
jgi:hypothetical protein